jgi:hypothetical protein
MNRSRPISQVEVESEILRLVEMLENETENFERLAQDAASKDAIFRSEWSKQYLIASGAVREREAKADVHMAEVMYDSKIADSLVKAKREKLLSLRSSIDALRTLNANVRAQT